MILKTKVYILKEDLSGLSEAEKEAYKAKKDFLGDDLQDKDMLLSTQLTDAVIDSKQHHLYIDMGEGVIRLRPLLGLDLADDEEYKYPTLSFIGDIDMIYEELIKENK